MTFLLDTCVVLWLMMEPERITPRLLESLADSQNILYVSSASTWEIIVKWQAGKLTLPNAPAQFFADLRSSLGVTQLAFEDDAALHLLKLPRLHADPFDRMLICQAIEHGLTIVTPDTLIQQYPIKTLWM
jgi:PIN domain nuclease of toxin-antitoxin system